MFEETENLSGELAFVYFQQVRRAIDLLFNNTGDLVAVFQAGHYEDGIASKSGWAQGDWNGDREFDTGDLVQAFQNGGFEKGPRDVATTTVPEPMSIVGVLSQVVLLTSILRRRHEATNVPR